MAALASAACTDPNKGSTGQLVLYANGGKEARQGISSQEFADGYAVEYEHAVLGVEQLQLGTMSGSDANVRMKPRVVDLIPAGVEVIRVDGLAAQRWDAVGFSSYPLQAEVENVNAPNELVSLMVERGYSFLQTGTLISPDGLRIPFQLGFPVEIDYFNCTSGDMTYGVVVPPNGTAEAEITWHLTHFWFDSFAEDSAYRAEAIAAVYDGTNPVQTEDLARQALNKLSGVDGGTLRDQTGSPVIYIPPQEPGVRTLRDFVLRARFGHFNGLAGSCDTEVRISETPAGLAGRQLPALRAATHGGNGARLSPALRMQ